MHGREKRAKRPFASQLVKRDARLVTTLVALGQAESVYPIGPGGNWSPTPGNSRLSMKEMDTKLRPIAVRMVANENMRTV